MLVIVLVIIGTNSSCIYEKGLRCGSNSSK